MNLTFDYEAPEAKRLTAITVKHAAGESCANGIQNTDDDACGDDKTTYTENQFDDE